MYKKDGIMEAIRLGPGTELAAYSTRQLQKELQRRKGQNTGSIFRWLSKQLPDIVVALASAILVILILVVIICTGYAC